MGTTTALGLPVPPATPALVLDRSALERNLAAMQALCDAAGVGLRAHGKMHKCSTLAKRQIALGAVGVCAQTVGEAEAFAAAGIPDILITAPVALTAAPLVAALVGRTRIAAVADDPRLIAAFGEAARAAGITLNVVIDIDLGQRRAGCPPEEAATLAQTVAATEGLRFDGVQAYLGHLQHVADLAERQAQNAAATARLKEIVRELNEAGLTPPRVTGGGTGTHAYDLAGGVFTELQAGSYAVMDREYDDCGAPSLDEGKGSSWPFSPAMFVATTVVSARQPTHATVDAGLKALSTDGPLARVVGGAAAGSKFRFQGDEHGAVIPPTPDAMPKLGDVIWLQPGHCDPTVNLYDAFLVWDGAGWERWPIDARRTMP